MNGHVTVIWSPIEGIGKTTVGSHLATSLVSQGAITLLVDLNRYASALPYVFHCFTEKSIKKACTGLSKEDVLKNCAEVPGKEGLFILSLSTSDKVDDLYRFSAERIEWILNTCRENVDQVVILMPSNYIETGFVAALAIEPDSMILVMDEDLSSWHRLKLYHNYFGELGIHIPKCVTVINKYVGILAIDTYHQLGIEMIESLIMLPYLEAVRKNRNDGYLISEMPLLLKNEREFYRGIQELVTFVYQTRERGAKG